MMRVMCEGLLYEKELERAKCDLANQGDFTIIDCFRFFDPNWKGHLTLTDLVDSFMSFTRNSKNIRHEDVFQVFQRYDKDQDGKLRYSEFADMMQPANMVYRKALLERKS